MRLPWARKAFTLLEILFVLGIITVLLSIIVPSFKGIHDESDYAKVRTDLAILQTALENYYSLTGEYPADEYDYQTALMQTTKLLKQYCYDPFGQGSTQYEYHRYAAEGAQYYVLISPGYNRNKDTDFSNISGVIDLPHGTMTVPAGNDDIIVTNLNLRSAE
jgi:prepilin-type N-terminal cleavage/methylation domain-containing protein